LAAALQPSVDPNVPVERARAAIARARQLTRERDDDGLMLDVLYFAGSAMADYAPIEERIAEARALLRCAEARGDRPRALHAYARLTMDEAQAADFEGFERDLAAMIELSRQLGHPRLRWR